MKKWKVVKREWSVEHSLKVGAFRLEVSAPIGSAPAAREWRCKFYLYDDEDGWIYTGKPETLDKSKARAFREVGAWLKRQQKAIEKALEQA